MHYIAFFLLITFTTVSCQICSQVSQFTQCVTDANNRIAQCGADIKNVPDLQYYICQCTEYKTSLTCYTLCPDDEIMQLQFREMESYANSVCSSVDMMKKQGFTATRSNFTASFTSTSTKTKVTSSATTTTTNAPSETSSPTPSEDITSSLQTTKSIATSTPRASLDLNDGKRFELSDALVIYPIVITIALCIVM